MVTGSAPTPQSSFRLFLQSELANRCARNPNYSLRAFAMHLGIDHSTLSQWLRGRRPITARSIESIGAKLGLGADSINHYVSRAARDDEATRGAWYLTAETMALVADWHHFAILELTRLESFRPDSRWIARVLGISVDEVNVALQRLIRLDLLDMASMSSWVDKSGDASVSIEGLATEVIEKQQEQQRRLSTCAVGALPLSAREHTSITVAVNSSALPRAFELIARFKQQLVELLQEGPCDDVYQIECAIFPVTTIKRERTQTPCRAR
ncbi:MAG TPA: TIGR02147 family protein [Vicinamibacterales bacterium]